MCRLFAQRSLLPARAVEPLCRTENALRFQSHKHPHGWGIAWYGPQGIRLRKGVLPAHEDDAFLAAARLARSPVILAHVRDASVGEVAPENTHPFVNGRWTFCHNGTVARYRRSAAVRRAIEAEIDVDLRPQLRGETDSERCFYLFLSRLLARRRPAGGYGLADLRAALLATSALVRRIADRGAEAESSLNFVVTDGRLLAACRWRRPLWVHQPDGAGGLFRVASERVGAGPWAEIPEGGFVGVDARLRVSAGALDAKPGRTAAA
ncbi:class II glutamine amidotransferase [Anaeromyxobacter paludicola]|uniref:Class II glutamine amidotransferase n=1 Tax=Anaeromyxobacter paludicola TaxID=2918171 RepID=A0ABN6N778_9BACT|nr:class II glutamine amidotransferase [Anaeromyxobacter paludicola]BDG07845.1 class II glutamine amidotransferase [Anaeromyxobacter paludicola]